MKSPALKTAGKISARRQASIRSGKGDSVTDITIPPEALEAAARAHAKMNEGHDEWWFLHVDKVRASCLAMLKEWPGMDTGPNIYGRQDAIIHLPLTQENTDAEA